MQEMSMQETNNVRGGIPIMFPIFALLGLVIGFSVGGAVANSK